MDIGVLLFVIARTAHLTEGRPVEYNEMTLDASVHILRCGLQRLAEAVR